MGLQVNTHRGNIVAGAFQTLKIQRWDDHRYYHHSRINQTLHLISAVSFLISYALLFIHPAIAALVAWGVSMTTRQVGHFFFEPKGYDHINDASFEFKEAVKVGYNLKRKVVLLGVWAALPAMLLIDPTFLNYLQPHHDALSFAINVGWLWFWLGVVGALFRVAQLTVTQSLETGVVWLIKIITDPLHDIKLYWNAPIYLLKGQIIDPEHGKQHF